MLLDEEKMRTVFAYLISPWAAALIVSLAIIPEGFYAAWQMLFVAAYVSYILSWSVGTVVFLLLRKLKRESVLNYAVTGAGCGIILSLFLLAQSVGGTEKGIFLGFVYFTFLTTSVATVFALIRNPRCPTSRDS